MIVDGLLWVGLGIVLYLYNRDIHINNEILTKFWLCMLDNIYRR